MLIGRCLMRPAVAEVRLMLQQFKMENMERAAKLSAAHIMTNSARVDNFNQHPAIIMQQQQLKANHSAESERMGSFTSMPKKIPSADADDHDVDYPQNGIPLGEFLDKCSEQISDLPPPIERKWIKKTENKNEEEEVKEESEKIRLLQWNVLSQALGTKNDNFVACPDSALTWRTRRFRMLEEVARHDADVICLQEVDHFPFLQKSLSALGYAGHFLPKPDSPCLYLSDNSGPDGCAIFYKTEKFDIDEGGFQERVIHVWHVESNQVVLLAPLRSKSTSTPLIVATTHLKARNGALLSTLRNEQGKDILNFIEENRTNSNAAVICTGDFNAEPTEPVYETMLTSSELGLTSDDLRLTSTFEDVVGSEAPFTTWKIRGDGEHKQTLDYIFHSDGITADSVLDLPSEEDVGESRCPSVKYASDHFSLVADFSLTASKTR